MTNKFKNYTAEEFMKLCFADDSGKIKNEDGYRFWKNFADININVWEPECLKIYDYANRYDALPDPDVNSYDLYEAHIRLWNIQYAKFNDKDIKDIERDGRCRCQIRTTDKQIILGSDSIMSIYWHRNFETTKDIMESIQNQPEELNTEIKNLQTKLNKIGIMEKPNKGFSLYRKFIGLYLQYTNTIGGFILFPRKPMSINGKRGLNSQIGDRFDLTLECIRRYYTKSSLDNPLYDVLWQNKEFFDMFKSFENYAKFFCLDESWIKDGHVLNLMDNKELDTYDFTKKPLPTNSTEWWRFYGNIMDRLDARNEQIKKLLEEK